MLVTLSNLFSNKSYGKIPKGATQKAEEFKLRISGKNTDYSRLNFLKVSLIQFQFVGRYDVVVNCTGYGSRELLGDQNLIPMKGHLIRVRMYVEQVKYPFGYL